MPRPNFRRKDTRSSIFYGDICEQYSNNAGTKLHVIISSDPSRSPTRSLVDQYFVSAHSVWVSRGTWVLDAQISKDTHHQHLSRIPSGNLRAQRSSASTRVATCWILPALLQQLGAAWCSGPVLQPVHGPKAHYHLFLGRRAIGPLVRTGGLLLLWISEIVCSLHRSSLASSHSCGVAQPPPCAGNREPF